MKNIIVTILGKSGTGKSTSIRNLDPKTTAIISTDSKPMPFRNTGGLKILNVTGELLPNKSSEMLEALDRLKNNKEIKTVVIDAFTQWSESLTFYCQTHFNGWDRALNYNNTVFKFFDKIQELDDKTVILFAHPVVGVTAEGEDTVVAKIDNKDHKGIIEERSTVLLMARVFKDGGSTKYLFETESNGKTPAKAPIGMFEKATIDNDLSLVVKAIKDYYEEPAPTPVQVSK